MLRLFREQPRAFPIIFMVEIWERFGFYTVQGILTLYFIRYLGFDDQQAYFTFGAFSALVYGMVALGGYLGDKVIGTKRMICLGLIILSLGYLSLSITDRAHVFWALGLICVGNGLFKANPSNLLAKCYELGDPRLHSAFTLYYMSINLGSIAALFLGPYVSSNYGYFYAYFLSFIGLFIGLGNFCFQRHHLKNIHTAADAATIKSWHWLFMGCIIVVLTLCASYLLQHVYLARQLTWIVTACTLVLYGFYMYQESARVRVKMLIAIVLIGEGIVFFILYQQMPTSLNLFAINNVNPTLLGVFIDPQSFQVLNPLWIIIMSPILAYAYKKAEKKGYFFPITYKFVSGMMCCSLSFMLLFFARFCHNEGGIVSSGWLIASYFFQSTGELLVSALGIAMIAELVPPSITGFVMGMWFLSISISSFLGASVASYTAFPTDFSGIDSLMLYTKVFGWIGMITFIVTGLMAILSTYLNKFIRDH